MSEPFTWAACEGRNDTDLALSLPNHIGVEALNMNLFPGQLGQKRLGSAAVTTTGDTYSGIVALFRIVPGQDDTAAELWIVSNDATVKILRIPTTTAAANLTLTNAISDGKWTVAVGLNGKVFLAANTPVNRLQVYSPSESTTVVRNTGITSPVAPAVINVGAGTYPAVYRTYRVQWRVYVGSTLIRASNLGTAVAITPSGTGDWIQVSKPTASSPAEGETHWVVFGAGANGVYYQLSTELVVGVTTVYNDTEFVSTYSTGTLAPLEGANSLFPSVKYLATNGTRLFGLGVWETSAANADQTVPVAGRLYFSPILDVGDGLGDDERIQNTAEQSDWINLSTNAGSVDRGIAGPLNDFMYAFQSRGIYLIAPTGQATLPYRVVTVSDRFGAVSHQSIVMAEDAIGNPAMYFLDPVDGPRRIGLGSTIDWLGHDVQALWATVNLSATDVAFGMYDGQNKRILWWLATGSSDVPDTILAYHVLLGRVTEVGDVRGGWAKWTGPLAVARAAVPFSSTLATPRLRRLVPYVGATHGTPLGRQDGSVNVDFTGVSYQAYVQSKAFDFEPLGDLKRITRGYVTAKAQASTSVQHSIITDWGAETRSETISLAAGGTETRVRPRLEALDVANFITCQAQIGDSAAANTTWTIDRADYFVELQKSGKP